MSKDIVIQEGGKGYPFGPVKCLMVEGENGEFYPWYPEAERALDSLSVTQNGIYRASDRGVYGWNRVSVNVAQSDRVTGKDPETGEEKTVTVDPQTGELVETVVPTEIRVTTLPTKMDYTDGETIDYSGIVVHAYSSTGQDMGAVPFGELVFPITTAHSESGQDYATSDLDTGAFSQPIPINGSASFSSETGGATWGYHWHDEYIVKSGTAMIIKQNNSSGLHFVIASASRNGGYTIKETKTAKDASGEQTINYEEHSLEGANTYTYNGKTVYWVTGGASGFNHLNPEPLVNGYGDNSHHAQAAWTAVYGTITGNDQSLPVQWQDPDSGAILETSFNITVTGGE